MTIYFLLNYFEYLPDIPNKSYIVVFMPIVWCLNYFLVVKREYFLNQDFQKDKKGGYIIIGVIVLTAIFSICVANLNREKIFNQKNYMESSNR